MPTTPTETLRDWDHAPPLAPVHAAGRLGSGRPADHRAGRGGVPLRRRGAPLSRRGRLALVQCPRPPAPGARCGDPGSNSSRWRIRRCWASATRPRSSWRGGWSSGAGGADACLLLRRRRHGRRGCAQDGVPVLAAEARPRAQADAIRRPRGGVPRRHARRRQRRRGRAVPRDLRAAALPRAPAPMPYCYRCPLGLERPECAIACLGAVERILEAHPGEVAAIVVEPLVQGAAGMIVHPEGYLRRPPRDQQEA